MGLVDDDPANTVSEFRNARFLGTTRDIPALVEKFKVHILIYAISNISPEENSRILQTCRETKARLIIIPIWSTFWKGPSAR